MLTLIIAILAFIIGGFLIYFILCPRLNNIQKLNEEIIKQNKELESKNLDLDD
jgi:predicted nucleic acid-binding protein